MADAAFPQCLLDLPEDDRAIVDECICGSLKFFTRETAGTNSEDQRDGL